MSSDTPLLEVREFAELNALLRAVVAAKFRPVAQDPELWAGPIMHHLAARVRDAYLQVARTRYGAAQAELWFRSLPENELLGVIKANLKSNAAEPWWRELSEEAKFAFVRGCLEPFIPSDAFVMELTRDAET